MSLLVLNVDKVRDEQPSLAAPSEEKESSSESIAIKNGEEQENP